MPYMPTGLEKPRHFTQIPQRGPLRINTLNGRGLVRSASDLVHYARPRQPLGEASENPQHYGVSPISASCPSQVSLALMHAPSAPNTPFPFGHANLGLQQFGGGVVGGWTENSLPTSISSIDEATIQSTRMPTPYSATPLTELTPALDINPLYVWSKQLMNYRSRQRQKQPTDKQVWPQWMEDVFLDSLLLMPIMGRRKFKAREIAVPWGRNEIICEYIVLAAIERGATRAEAERERKQVSSHMQVVKPWFKQRRIYHFLFHSSETRYDGAPAKDKKKKDDTPTFANNPVLLAIKAERLPDVRANYAYWHRLLALDELVVVQPKTCWIYVASNKVHKDENGVAWGPEDVQLSLADYPHLTREGKTNAPASGTLLHEYARELSQAHSGSIRDTARDWAARFPAMYTSLDLPTRDEDCVVYEMSVRLDVSSVTNFPAESHLHSLVEMNITKSGFERHTWQCRTRLARPRELCGADDETDGPLLEQCGEVGVQFTHRRGCASSYSSSASPPSCKCMDQPLRSLRLPFLATQWATTLSNLAAYPDGPEKRDGRRKTKSMTVAHLLDQVAMVQELWSAPKSHENEKKWTRQAVVIWKFASVWQREKGGKSVRKPSQTTWRYLTVVDPMSYEHQSNVYLGPDGMPFTFFLESQNISQSQSRSHSQSHSQIQSQSQYQSQSQPQNQSISQSQSQRASQIQSTSTTTTTQSQGYFPLQPHQTRVPHSYLDLDSFASQDDHSQHSHSQPSHSRHSQHSQTHNSNHNIDTMYPTFDYFPPTLNFIDTPHIPTTMTSLEGYPPPFPLSLSMTSLDSLHALSSSFHEDVHAQLDPALVDDSFSATGGSFNGPSAIGEMEGAYDHNLLWDEGADEALWAAAAGQWGALEFEERDIPRVDESRVDDSMARVEEVSGVEVSGVGDAGVCEGEGTPKARRHSVAPTAAMSGDVEGGAVLPTLPSTLATTAAIAVLSMTAIPTTTAASTATATASGEAISTTGATGTKRKRTDDDENDGPRRWGVPPS